MRIPALSPDVLGSRTVTLAAVAFAFALGIAAVGYFVFSAGAGSVDGKNLTINFGPIGVPLRGVVFTLFLLAFVIIWFLLYSQFMSEAGDLYSSLRKKLVGNWSVQYEVAPGQRVRNQWEALPAINCSIALNPAQKLEIHYDVKGNPLFADASEVIQVISLTHDVANKYWFSYYYKKDRDVTPQLSTMLLNAANDHPLTSIEIEIFANLQLEDVRAKKTIDALEGQWFDLNGNLIRLFSLSEEFVKSENRDKNFRLSQAHVDRDNFVALMGNIRFSRISPAQEES
jgi:hypothetical protein